MLFYIFTGNTWINKIHAINFLKSKFDAYFI